MNTLSMFNRSQAERFQRHFALAGFGIDAQAKLMNSRAVVIGAGGLGAPILTYLTAAGVGSIDIIDHDVVDRSNLHRQVIHSEDTIGQPKTASAAATMRGLHPEVKITEHQEAITEANALRLIEPADIVIDGSDNFTARYVVSDACEIAHKPLVSGSILRYSGQVSLFWSRLPSGERGPTYRDLYPEAPDPGEVPTCAEAGVLGVLPGVVGSLMATEAIKFLAEIGEPLIGRVITYDALNSHFGEFRLRPDPEREPVTSMDGGRVPEPGPVPTPAPAAHDDAASSSDPEESAVPGDLDFNPFTGEPKQHDDFSPAEFQQAAATGKVGLILDVREPHEHNAGSIESAVNVPLMELWRSEEPPAGLEDATEEAPAVVYCEHGVRSRQALAMIRQRFPDAQVKNLLGGYALWQQR
ncbi:molybdopterin-synthase adenylyltransferase MoeB [Nesterenkonia haasae]|uniref:molybdopterin-synthase adenylyltransferase MoeB n=1 Tax=Nesterenkonia haasae TaxID=2587813 RepID=UPI001391E3A4|nr:molybdopterin-synthase adenylyltransferase MoeB [Nesterenkonia haasae]NDK33090.1 molybdopterin-synthase adenylyltransferase MoeB [Nesterenkonia haasae]